MPELAESTVAERCCTKCNATKPMTSFGRKGNWWCLECRRAYAAKWRQENHESHRLQKLAWRQSNRDRVNEVRRKYRQNNRHVTLRESLRRKYDIGLQEYNEMLARSGGLCAICGKQMNGPCVDHDHATGLVRDLLCRNCNQGLGHFHDNIADLEAAIAYLKKHKGEAC
jgi:hypothetical protein